MNHPPAARISVANIMNYVEKAIDPQSWEGFKQHVQNYASKGAEYTEIVPREILETAKGCLSKLQTFLWRAETWISKSVTVLNKTSVINGVGAGLIALGILGTYSARTKATASQTQTKEKTSKNTFYNLVSYTSIITGLALVIFSTYRIHSTANYLNHILTKLPE